MQESTFFHEFWHIIQFYLYNNNQYYREKVLPKFVKLHNESIKIYKSDLKNKTNNWKKTVVRKYSLKKVEEDWATLFENLNDTEKFKLMYEKKWKIYKEKIDIIKNYIYFY